MKNITIKDKNGLDIELSAIEIGNTVILEKDGSNKRVLIFRVDPKKIKEIQDVRVTGKQEKEILGPVLYKLYKESQK